MPTRDVLIDQVRETLARAGFAISERCEVRPISFDVVARRDNVLLILKILGNVDALTEQVAQELRTLARFLNGVPLLVGERSSAGALEDGVAYAHRGVPVLTVGTLRDHVLENVPPLAHATPGGLHVRLNGTLLRRLREERALSLGLLAQAGGVSRRAIQMYEEGMRATIEAALRLEEYLHESLIDPIDPFELFAPTQGEERPDEWAVRADSTLEESVFRMLRSVGFRVVPTGHSPFNAVTKQAESTTILTGVDHQTDAQTRRRAQLLTSIASVTEKDGMLVVRREIRFTNLQGTPVVGEKELERIRDPDELTTLLVERKKPSKGE